MSSSKIITNEVVALPGIKGEKGDPFTYDDFTPEQIAELQRPATEAAKVANAAAQRAEAAAESVQGAVEDAEQASQSAQQAATEAQEAVKNAKAVIDKAETAINNANTATEQANAAVESVNALEERVEQAEATRAQSEEQRQTAETNRASSEQRREANETQRQEKFAQIESDATSLENSINEAEAQRVSAENARKEAETQRETADQNRETEFSEIKNEAETLITQTTEAKDAANSAATSATNAASAANTAAESANEAAELANQAAQNVDGRVTSLEEKASQVYANLAAIESSGETNPNKIYIDGETIQPYIYKGGSFVPFSGIKPKGGYNRSLFEAAGAVFNEDTGYYELYADEGGLTDITEEQMCDIYTQTAHLSAMKGENYNLFSLTCRTNFKGRVSGNVGIGINEIYAYGSSNLEILFLENIRHVFSNTGIVVSLFSADDFYNCVALKKVIGPIRIERVTKDVIHSYSIKIEDIKFSGLKVNFNFFEKDEVINYESIKYLVDNAQNTSAITITVHPTTYGYLTGTISPTSQVGGTTEEWQAIVTTAQEKQITFATTE